MENVSNNGMTIICAYSGAGKSVLSANGAIINARPVIDLDSYGYSSHPEFPKNYVAQINRMAKNVAYMNAIVLCSVHPAFLAMLREHGYDIVLVYPDDSVSKADWLSRIYNREENGSSSLYEELHEKYTDHISSLNAFKDENPSGVRVYRLGKKQYLKDIIGEILA